VTSEGNALLPAFEGEEDKILFLRMGPSNSAAELMLKRFAAACGHDVVWFCRRIGVARCSAKMNSDARMASRSFRTG